MLSGFLTCRIRFPLLLLKLQFQFTHSSIFFSQMQTLLDQLKPESFIQPAPNPFPPSTQLPHPSFPSNHSLPNSSQMQEGEVKDGVAARKMQKADREKLRRDRLNEHFMELGNVLDPDRPKNDKATILADTIQVLKDLSSEVDKLKTECSTLTEESREFTNEKNELREEKASLKTDIENLNAQYQQRLRAMFPWGAVDHSVVMAPPSYPYPMPMPMPPGSIPMHPHMQPYPYFGNQNPRVFPNPCSTFVPYISPNTLVEPQPSPYVSPVVHPATQSHVSVKQDSRKKSSVVSVIDKGEDSNDVTTDLELKTPGSTTDQDSSPVHRKSQKSARKELRVTEETSSSRCSSSHSVQGSSSDNVVGGRKDDD